MKKKEEGRQDGEKKGKAGGKGRKRRRGAGEIGKVNNLTKRCLISLLIKKL
jgi:hypothetical protein